MGLRTDHLFKHLLFRELVDVAMAVITQWIFDTMSLDLEVADTVEACWVHGFGSVASFSTCRVNP